MDNSQRNSVLHVQVRPWPLSIVMLFQRKILLTESTIKKRSMEHMPVLQPICFAGIVNTNLGLTGLWSHMLQKYTETFIFNYNWAMVSLASSPTENHLLPYGCDKPTLICLNCLHVLSKVMAQIRKLSSLSSHYIENCWIVNHHIGAQLIVNSGGITCFFPTIRYENSWSHQILLVSNFEI